MDPTQPPPERSSTDPTDPVIGETIASRYLVEARLGDGVTGTTYRARHIKVGRPFVVKVLHARLLSDPQVVRRFEHEAELAGRLRHPNVVGVVDVGETDHGTHYLVTDFAEGRDLARLLSEAPFAPARVRNLTRQLLEGLFHAHEAGLVHRALEAKSVIVERDAHGHEVPRIVDFGIAVLAASAAPGADASDHRIDLGALGVVVYEMLGGKPPFDGTRAEVAYASRSYEPPPIAQRVPHLEVDPLLEAFARWLMMMARSSDANPLTARAARELLDVIERDSDAAAASLGVTLGEAPAPTITQVAPPSATPPRPSDDVSPRPNPRSRAIIIAVIAVVGIALAIVTVKLAGATPP